MRILGIDPGSLICGYGMIAVGAGGRPGGLEGMGYVECGVLTAPASRSA